MFLLGEMQRVLYAYGETETAKKLEDLYNKHNDAFKTRVPDRSDF